MCMVPFYIHILLHNPSHSPFLYISQSTLVCRCPLEAGIKFNFDAGWTKELFEADKIDTLDANLAFHGCPDFDKDGIPDRFDACPRESGDGCSSGCPSKGVDKDGDGVDDCIDRCPTVAAPGTKDGCPDMDGDGTADDLDYWYVLTWLLSLPAVVVERNVIFVVS